MRIKDSTVLPPMVKCSECVYAFKYYDNILEKSRYACSIMQEIGEFDDFYAIVDSGCVYGIKKSAETAISADNGSNQTINNYGYLNCNTKERK